MRDLQKDLAEFNSKEDEICVMIGFGRLFYTVHF